MKNKYLWLAGSILYLAPMVCLWEYAHHVAALPSAHRTAINVLDYGAAGDGTTDDSVGFAKAFAEADSANLPLIIPKKNYAISQPIAIRTGMVIRSDGAILKHIGNSAAILTATNVSDWVIEGPLTLLGTRTAAGQQGDETGLLLAGCSHYIVDKVTVRNFTGKGIEIDTGNLGWSARGDHGQFAFVSFIDNATGLQIDQSIGAEYNLFTLLSFSGNETAARIAGGNNVVTTSNIVDNDNGVQLASGSNHGHGIFSAVNINHSKGFNLESDDITSGYTFNACHMYGDSNTAGIVHLNGSSGIHMSGGTLDAAIINDGGGVNMLADEYIAGDKFAISGTNAKALHTQSMFDSKEGK